MPGLETSIAFFCAALILALAPGPDNIFVLTQSALFGSRAGILTTFGLASGLCVQTAAVAFGVGALIKAWPLAFTLLKIFGAAYLCWLAWLSLRAGPAATGAAEFPGYGALYRRGIVMNVTNPKVLLFFLAFLPQFCEPGAGPLWLQMIYFGMLFIIAALLIFIAIALMGGRLALWFNKSARSQLAMHRLSALIFLGLAAWLVIGDI